MNPPQLYQFSLDLNSFVKKVSTLDVFHWYRYKYFIDNSNFDDPSIECKYAVRTRDLGEKQSVQLYTELIEARDLLNQLIQVFDEQ